MTSNTNIHLRETDDEWLAMDTNTGVTAKGQSREEVLENLDTAVEQHSNPNHTEPVEIDENARQQVENVLNKHDVDYELDEQLAVIKIWIGTRMYKESQEAVREHVQEAANTLVDYGTWNGWHWLRADVSQSDTDRTQ